MKSLYNQQHLKITLDRLTAELIENHKDFSNAVIIGMQPRGVLLADRIVQLLRKELPNSTILYGKLDITFYRDDYNTASGGMQIPTETNIDFSLEGKNVILIDDVLYTGRSIRSGLDALLDFGRPKCVELLVLIDRWFSREVPIQPDYVGKTVESVTDQKVKVLWQDIDGRDEVVLI
jgi:pyrimidine operon attenuation protein/uracil phosphoribosyltransferase